MSFCSMPKKIEPFLCLNKKEFDYLNSERSLTKKMFMMANMLSLTTDENCIREKIVTDIFHFLRPYYPECDLLIFGSSANGFGFRGCDLDLLFLPFPDYCNSDFQDKGNGSIPSPFKILNGTVPRDVLYEMDEEMHLKFVMRVMRSLRSMNYFKKLIFIPAKCPIINVEFVFNTLHCDFSASNRLVLYNTQLMFLYGRLDPRVKPLVMFLRFWAKSLGFISKSLLSSYGLTLLVIFYLQNTHLPVLPSVRDLKEIADYSRVIDGWETAISLRPDCIDASRFRNERSPGELLIQFFDFYWNFDFVQNIVSVHEGKPLPVELIKKSKDHRIQTFQVTPFSIQDPLILCRNISRNTTMKTSFKLSLMIAKNLLHKNNFDFQLLFDPTFYQDEMRSMFAQIQANLLPASTFLTLQLTYEVHKKLRITSQLKPWFDTVSLAVLDILRYGLLLDCEVVDAEDLEPPVKKKKFNIYNIGDMKLILSIQCVANFPTLWSQNRSDVLEHLKKTDANFELEDSDIEIPACLKKDYKVSKELSKDEIKNITKLPESELPYLSFTCDFFHYPESQLSDVIITFAPLTPQRKNYNRTKEFLRSFVQKHIKSVLEEV